MNNYYSMNNSQNYQPNTPPNNMYNQNFYDPYQGFIRGTMFPSLYETYKIESPLEIVPMNDQAKLLTNIDALTFATIDLNLYLDVNPDNEEAITLFNQYRYQKDQLVKNYENAYGPLSLNSDTLNTTPWMWDNKPWPWEN